MDQSFRSRLAGESNLTLACEVADKLLTRAAVIRMLNWVWNICSQQVLSTPHGCQRMLQAPPWAAWTFSWQGSWLPSEEVTKREHGWSRDVFPGSASEVTYQHSRPQYLSDHTAEACSVGEGATQGVTTRRKGPLEATLDSGYCTTWVLPYIYNFPKKGVSDWTGIIWKGFIWEMELDI